MKLKLFAKNFIIFYKTCLYGYLYGFSYKIIFEIVFDVWKKVFELKLRRSKRGVRREGMYVGLE